MRLKEKRKYKLYLLCIIIGNVRSLVNNMNSVSPESEGVLGAKLDVFLYIMDAPGYS